MLLYPVRTSLVKRLSIHSGVVGGVPEDSIR